MPGTEVINLVFANDDVVCITWKYRAEETVTSLLHKNEVIGAGHRGGKGPSVSLSRPAAKESILLRHGLGDIHSAEGRTITD